jgi:hypothetical protein
MKQVPFACRVLAVVALVLAGSRASAQATRTWVSGVGDDANPCSRTAPCKTFAGAISKTAFGGTINALDPGGFGAVTITKSVTIDGGGELASVLAAGTNGIVVNAGPNDVVTIRNVGIEGAGTGLNGIRFLAGGTLFVENCVIANFTQKGIDFEPGASSRLFVKDTIIRNNAGTSGGGVLVKPGASGTAQAVLDRVRMEGNFFGLFVADRSTVTVRNSVASGHTNSGFTVGSTAAAVVLNLENCVVSNNNALASTTGILCAGGQATVRLSNVTVVNNGIGLSSVTGGGIVSFRNNSIAGNVTDGAPTSTVTQQ